jgi:hypothetical protein
MPQGTLGHAQDHGPVPLHQRLKGRLVVAVQEGTEQGAVGPPARVRVVGQLPDVPEDFLKLRGCHRYVSPQGFARSVM